MGALPNFNNELRPLSEEEISRRNLEDSEIWYLMINEIPHGPYDLYDLKFYLENNENFDSETLASNQQDSEWQPIYKFPIFSRRKPQLANKKTEEELMPEVFYLIINGQVDGPFEQDQISQRLDQKELLFTDQISIDGGTTWRKVHEMAFFERRHLSEQSLPFMPDETNFEESTKRIFQLLSKKDKNEALYNIVKIHNNHTGETELLEEQGISNQSGTDQNEETEISVSKPKSNSKLYIVIIISLLAAYIMYSMRSTPTDINEPIKKSKNVTNKKIKPKNTKKKRPSSVRKRKPGSKLSKISRSKIRRDAQASKVKIEIRKKENKKKNFEDTSTYSEFHSQTEGNAPKKKEEDSEDDLQDSIASEISEERPSDGYEEELRFDDEGLLGENEFDNNDRLDENSIDNEIEF